MSKVFILNKYKPPVKVDKTYFIGRGSGIGNPFTYLPSKYRGSVRVKDRETACKMYEERFIKAVKLDKLPPILYQMKADIEDGKTIGLVCFCSPLMCHGETIKKWLEGTLEVN